ncbi:unnamed protein product [Adineta steineri]|uniref:ADP ribosyltransferase domain-containing protein n=1 Tax=Adineta steineri TaxID=433720 RepID=A0A819PHA8_9BILA|nr:unnamed protein product [Adineta steineri]
MMNSRKSTATNETNDALNKYPFPEDAEGRRRINIQQMQDVLLIWLDGNIDETHDDCKNTIKQLRRAINEINTFTDGDKCFEFIRTIINKKACMILSGSLGQHVVPRVHNISQIDSIFIFCENQNYHEQWIKEWPKVKGIFTDITSICEALKSAAHQCEQNAIPMSFVESNKKLDQLDPSFMYTQLIKEILLSIKFEQKHIQDYINYCRDVFGDNEKEMVHIKQFEDEYYDEPPIFWYTCDMFLYPMLNRALRLMDGDIITRMGFFIGDLHRNIEQLYQKQYAGKTAADIFILYRGQGLTKGDFEQMMKAKGGLVSFNNFLSTSENIKVSLGFAQDATTHSDQVGVLFIMQINSSQSTTPFASIASISAMKREKEVLFSMHSVFRIQDIKQMDGNNRLYEVKLILTADNDPELSRLTDYIRKESFPDTEGWYRLGSVLYNMGQFKKAEDIYQHILDQSNDKKDKAYIYYQVGSIKDAQGKYEEALLTHEKALAIREQSLPPNHPDLAKSYNNIGNVNSHMGNYPTALSYYKKALQIWQRSLSPNHPDLAMFYNSIGNVHDTMGSYPEALSSHEKALAIREQSLPHNHPHLAKSYNNIGNAHNHMGNYPTALSYYEKALEISQQSLPPNHPDLTMTYNNIGLAHSRMGNYPKAFSYYDKALQIWLQSFPPNHPDLAMCYNNIGSVHASMGKYPDALPYYEKALAIREQLLPPNHLDLAKCYNNIGVVHENMNNYPTALSFYEKALEIRQQSLPPDHLDLTMSFDNIGSAYNSMDNYPKALSSYENALEIRQQSLPPNHPDLAVSYNKIGNIHKHMSNYPKALSYYEKALEIWQQSISSNHPHLAKSYNNIGDVHNHMGNYSEAVLFHEKALEIQQQSLPSNYPDVARSYNDIGNVHHSMGNNSKARTFYEYAIEIEEQLPPSNHPDLRKYRNNLED